MILLWLACVLCQTGIWTEWFHLGRLVCPRLVPSIKIIYLIYPAQLICGLSWVNLQPHRVNNLEAVTLLLRRRQVLSLVDMAVRGHHSPWASSSLAGQLGTGFLLVGGLTRPPGNLRLKRPQIAFWCRPGF